MKLFKLLLAVAGSALIAGTPHSGMAQEYPNKVVTIINPFPAGAPGDVIARLVGEKLRVSLKQPFIVDNRPGAGGNIGAGMVAKSAPDGYTLMAGPDTILTVNPSMYRKLPFGPNDFTPITYLANFSQVLVCNPSVPVKTVSDLIALAKKENLTYASGGIGVPGHLAAELFLSKAGIRMTHVPYKGPSPAVQDVMGGQVHCGFLTSPVAMPLVKANKLTALAVSGTKRSLLAPNVPTLAEAGIPGYDATFAEILAAPKGTPESVIKRLHDEVVKALQQPDVRERLLALDLEPVGNTPTDAAKRIKDETAKWTKIVQQAGVRLD